MCGRYRVSRLELEADVSKSLMEQIREARESVESREAPVVPAVTTRAYDPEMADAILAATVDLYGGEKAWKVNFKGIENGGKNAKGEPGVLGALNTQKFSTEHPKNVTLYNGNGGPNGVFGGFSEADVDTIYEAAAKALGA